MKFLHHTGAGTELAVVATVRKTITLSDQQDQWIKAQIKAGQYTNDK